MPSMIEYRESENLPVKTVHLAHACPMCNGCVDLVRMICAECGIDLILKPQTREEYERDIDAHERMTGQHAED